MGRANITYRCDGIVGRGEALIAAAPQLGVVLRDGDAAGQIELPGREASERAALVAVAAVLIALEETARALQLTWHVDVDGEKGMVTPAGIDGSLREVIALAAIPVRAPIEWAPREKSPFPRAGAKALQKRWDAAAAAAAAAAVFTDEALSLRSVAPRTDAWTHEASTWRA